MEGDYSKQNSTVSIVSERSQQEMKSDPVFDLPLQMTEALAVSQGILNSH